MCQCCAYPPTNAGTDEAKIHWLIDNTKIYYNVKLSLSIMLHFFQNIIDSRQCSTFSSTTSLQSMNVVHSSFMIRSFWLAVYTYTRTAIRYYANKKSIQHSSLEAICVSDIIYRH